MIYDTNYIENIRILLSIILSKIVMKCEEQVSFRVRPIFLQSARDIRALADSQLITRE